MTHGGELKLCLTRNLQAARKAVLEVRRFLEAQGVKGQVLEDCELALAEACNNAVMHHPIEAGLTLAVFRREGCVEIRVIDEGPAFPFPGTATLPPPESESGRGLFLIESLMDEAKLECHESRHELVLRKRIPN